MKKLTLNRQVIRNLSSDETADAQGGGITAATKLTPKVSKYSKKASRFASEVSKALSGATLALTVDGKCDSNPNN